MNSQTFIDLLDQHHSQLPRGARTERRGLPLQAAALFTLVTLLWDLLRPVQPAPAFRAGLSEQLVAEAQRQRTQKAIGIHTARQPARGMWIAPVAALGAVSLVGAYAFWRRWRQQEATEQPLAA